MDANTQTSAPHLLLMEDEPLARWVALKALEEIGTQVMEAASCTEARQHLDTFEFDLLILDYRLPDGLGTSVAAYAREIGRHGPVILLSADADDFSADASAHPTFAAVLSKPLDVEALQRTVREQIQARSESPAQQTATTDTTTWVDRFRLVALPEHTDAAVIAAISCTPEDKGWIALDVRQTLSLSPECAPLLDTLAGQCLARGGRLALLGGNPDLIQRLRERSEASSYDRLPDARALEALSRRLSSFCERASLLASVIPRDVDTESAL